MMTGGPRGPLCISAWFSGFALFVGEAPLPMQNFQATIRVRPIVDGDRAFVEWFATFDCEPAAREERVAFFRDAFAGWLDSLRRHLLHLSARAG